MHTGINHILDKRPCHHSIWPTPLRDTDRCDRKSTAIERRRATLPEELVGHSTSLAGFAREVAAWLVYVDPKHELEGTLRATKALTDGRHAEDDKDGELDYEFGSGQSATEGAVRSTVLKVTSVEPRGPRVRGMASAPMEIGMRRRSRWNDPAKALQPTLATPKKNARTQRNRRRRVTARHHASSESG